MAYCSPAEPLSPLTGVPQRYSSFLLNSHATISTPCHFLRTGTHFSMGGNMSLPWSSAKGGALALDPWQCCTQIFAVCYNTLRLMDVFLPFTQTQVHVLVYHSVASHMIILPTLVTLITWKRCVASHRWWQRTRRVQSAAGYRAQYMSGCHQGGWCHTRRGSREVCRGCPLLADNNYIVVS